MTLGYVLRSANSPWGQSLGWTVDVADSGEQALQVLRTQAAAGIACSAVFVDWQMPGLDGWETGRQIREMWPSGEPPIIVMVTAHGREKLAQRSADEQGRLDAFLVKPVTASMLADALVDARSARAHGHVPQVAVLTNAPRLSGMRLLVAEDNPNNQQVARELLEQEGALVRIVGDGQAALEAVAEATPMFDVVLMDLQMPVIDGYTATSRIRNDLALQTLPIIAMTANAMDSDRTSCLAAGMNDHVGKPFDLNQLVEVLRKHAGWTAAAGDTGAAERMLPAAVNQAATAAGVDIDAALVRLGGKRGVYQRMLHSVAQDLDGMLAQLAACAAQGQAAQAARLLHTLKGLAGTLGAVALSAEAARGETLLDAAPAPAMVARIVERACSAFTAARPRLAALSQALRDADAPSAGTATPPDADALRRALHTMAAQLQNSDMAATDAMAALRRQFGGILNEDLQPLDEAIGALDFERALHLCHELLQGQPA